MIGISKKDDNGGDDKSVSSVDDILSHLCHVKFMI